MGAKCFSLCLAIAVGIAAALPFASHAGPFTVGGVNVDASGASAQQAQARALASGQSLALSRLYRKLTRESDHSRLPAIEAGDVERLVRSYEVGRERRSAQRYIAELTVHFDPDGVRDILRSAGIPFAETESLPRLIVPLLEGSGELRLWEEPNLWRDAWREIAWRHHLVNLALPYGELEDLTAISAEQARDGNPEALATIAKRYNAPETLVALARLETGGGVSVTATRHVGDDAAIVFSRRIPANASTAATLRQAAQTMAEALEGDWKLANLVDFSSVSTLDVNATLSGLDSWLSIRRRFDGMSQLAGTQVVSLSRSKAHLTLRYYGALEALSDALDGRGLSLIDAGGGEWRIEAKGVATVLPETLEEPALPEAIGTPAGPAPEALPEVDPEEDLLFE